MGFLLILDSDEGSDGFPTLSSSIQCNVRALSKRAKVAAHSSSASITSEVIKSSPRPQASLLCTLRFALRRRPHPVQFLRQTFRWTLSVQEQAWSKRLRWILLSLGRLWQSRANILLVRLTWSTSMDVASVQNVSMSLHSLRMLQTSVVAKSKSRKVVSRKGAHGTNKSRQLARPSRAACP